MTFSTSRVRVERLREEVRRDLFRIGRGRGRDRRVGVEVEVIPTWADDGTVVPVGDTGGRQGAAPVDRDRRIAGSWALLEGLADELAWEEGASPAGARGFRLPGGGAISFEPGGQLEYSSPAHASLREVVDALDGVLRLLRRRAEDHGIRFLTVGIDPVNPIEGAELYVRNERYSRMARHFDRFGLSGRRMMRQTAAIHVNLDFGAAPLDRFDVANRLAPYVTAIFANSSRYQGRPSGFRSFRAQQWRVLDSGRTGLVTGDDPVEDYLEFALEAPAILLGPADAEARPFRQWWDEDMAGQADWRSHLTTLFPEVRPRGYLEVRAIDALDPGQLAAPLVFLAGLLYDRGALEGARELLATPTPDDLAEAGRVGLGDPERARRAVELVELAVAGARRLGEAYVGGEVLERAESFFATLTHRGWDPASLADDPRHTSSTVLDEPR